jgi:hypothetical protein
LGKTERYTVEEVESPTSQAWLIGLSAWLVPGAGHLMLKRWGRAALMGGAVWICFFIALYMGGHMFELSSGQGQATFTQMLLQIPPIIGNLGTGLLYIVSWILGIGFGENLANAARTTYEYGNMLLIIVGLANYLTALDAFDIAAGRKS